MKTRLHLTIDDSILKKMKSYARKHGMSISEMVEHHFEVLLSTSKRKSFIDLVESLEKPSISNDADLKELYYKERAGKYGY